MEGLEDGDLVAALGQGARGREPGRSGTDDGDRLTRRGRIGGGERVGVGDGPVGNETFEVADGDRRAGLGAQADLLALRLLRADTARDARQGVVAK